MSFLTNFIKKIKETPDIKASKEVVTSLNRIKRKEASKMKKKPALVTLCIGNKYLRMGIALMQSCHPFLKNEVDYIVFYTNANPEYFKLPSWVIFEKIDEIYLIENRWSGRQYKSIPLSHKKYVDRDVLYLDADTLVYKNKFAELFQIIRTKSVLVYGTSSEDDAIWFKDEKKNSYFNLKKQAKLAGYDVYNLHINSGIMGRASDKIGIKFTKLLEEFLANPPFKIFEKSSYFNDEPYVSIAFQMSTKGTDKGNHSLDYKTYVTTAGAYLSNEDSGWPTVHKPHLGVVAEKCAIIHYVGHTNFTSYLKEIEQKVSYSFSGIIGNLWNKVSKLVRKNRM